MNPLRTAIARVAALRRRRIVPIERLLCNDKPIAKRQGFARRPITDFPVSRAFHLYLENPAAGIEYLIEWYREQIFERKVWRFPKRSGGMATGSLARAAERLHTERGLPWTGFESAERELIDEAIHERVSYYFELLESIRRNGFRRELGPPIQCSADRGFFELINGHHRVAALEALGYRQAAVEVRPMSRMHKVILRLLASSRIEEAR